MKEKDLLIQQIIENIYQVEEEELEALVHNQVQLTQDMEDLQYLTSEHLMQQEEMLMVQLVHQQILDQVELEEIHKELPQAVVVDQAEL
jgi:hypothetical protein